MQAETGFMYLNGTPESGPLKMPVAFMDILAAHQMKEGILVALIKKLKTGKGSKVAVSLFDSAVSALANQASSWLCAGINPQPIGSLHPTIAPYGEIFTTNDNKKIVLAIGNNKQFSHLCEILKIENNIIFQTNPDRVKNRNELYKIIQFAISLYEAKALMQKMQERDIPAGIIKSVNELFETKATTNLVLNKTCVKTAVYNIND